MQVNGSKSFLEAILAFVRMRVKGRLGAPPDEVRMDSVQDLLQLLDVRQAGRMSFEIAACGMWLLVRESDAGQLCSGARVLG